MICKLPSSCPARAVTVNDKPHARGAPLLTYSRIEGITCRHDYSLTSIIPNQERWLDLCEGWAA